ncbi:MAG: KH domain-containing protein [Oscillospiraceae bacterium]
MKELLEVLAKGLVNNKESVSVTVDEPNKDEVIVYHLHVAPEDMGRIIGKQGRIAKALRVIMRAGARRINQRISIEID